MRKIETAVTRVAASMLIGTAMAAPALPMPILHATTAMAQRGDGVVQVEFVQNFTTNKQGVSDEFTYEITPLTKDSPLPQADDLKKVISTEAVSDVAYEWSMKGNDKETLKFGGIGESDIVVGNYSYHVKQTTTSNDKNYQFAAQEYDVTVMVTNGEESGKDYDALVADKAGNKVDTPYFEQVYHLADTGLASDNVNKGPLQKTGDAVVISGVCAILVGAMIIVIIRRRKAERQA